METQVQPSPFDMDNTLGQSHVSISRVIVDALPDM